MKHALALILSAFATSVGAFASQPPTASDDVARSASSVAPDVSRTDRLAYEAELLADADSRASGRGDEQTSGFIKNRFTLSDGGPNTMRIGGLMQLRYLANFRDRPEESEDSFTHGFQDQRVRLKVDGTVWDKHFGYIIVTELSGPNGTSVLLDAEGRYTFDNKVYVRAGQFKPLFLREELVADGLQLTVERSITNAVFTMSRSQGVGIGWSDADFRMGADISDGANQLNSTFNARTEADFAITGRFDWKFAGDDFKRFDDFTSWRDAKFAGMWGAAIDYETYGDTGAIGAATVDRDFVAATTDVSLEGNGWNAFAAFIYRGQNKDGIAHRDDYGVIAQGGVFITDQTELFARYDIVIPDDAGGPDNFSTATAGVNYYLSPQSHVAQLTADVVYYIDTQSRTAIVPAQSTTSNLLRDTDDGQWGIRLQLQVIY